MAAEKLTKGRFIQIFILFVLLLFAFLWRTVEYSNKTSQQDAGLMDDKGREEERTDQMDNAKANKNNRDNERLDWVTAKKGADEGVYLDEMNIEELNIKNIYIR